MSGILDYMNSLSCPICGYQFKSTRRTIAQEGIIVRHITECSSNASLRDGVQKEKEKASKASARKSHKKTETTKSKGEDNDSKCVVNQKRKALNSFDGYDDKKKDSEEDHSIKKINVSSSRDKEEKKSRTTTRYKKRPRRKRKFILEEEEEVEEEEWEEDWYSDPSFELETFPSSILSSKSEHATSPANVSLSPSTTRLQIKTSHESIIEPEQKQQQEPHQQQQETLNKTKSNLKNNNSLPPANNERQNQIQQSQHKDSRSSKKKRNNHSSLATTKDNGKDNNILLGETKKKHIFAEENKKEMENLIQTQQEGMNHVQCKTKEKEFKLNENGYPASKRRTEASTTVCPICAKVFNRAIISLVEINEHVVMCSEAQADENNEETQAYENNEKTSVTTVSTVAVSNKVSTKMVVDTDPLSTLSKINNSKKINRETSRKSQSSNSTEKSIRKEKRKSRNPIKGRQWRSSKRITLTDDEITERRRQSLQCLIEEGPAKYALELVILQYLRKDSEK